MIVILAEEHGKLPSGVVRIIQKIVNEWSDEQFILITNRMHWIGEVFEGVDLKTYSLITTGDLSYMMNLLKLRKCFGFLKRVILSLSLLCIVPFIIFRLIWIFKANNVNAIFSHNGGYPGGQINRLAVIAGYIAGIKNNYLVIHNVPEPIRNKFVQGIYDKLIALCSSEIITVSNACKDELMLSRFKNTDVKVIYNGIQHSGFGEEDVPINSSKSYIIGFVGEIHPRKGLDVLIEALQMIPAEINFEIHFYGSGDIQYIDDLKSKMHQFNIFNRARFYGYRDDAFALMSDIDLLVLPSIAYESFGIVLLEAMYWQKPVICSDFGGMKEVVVDGETGIVVAAGDAYSLSGAIVELATNPSRGRAMGLAGKKRLINNFSIRATVEGYRALVYSK